MSRSYKHTPYCGDTKHKEDKRRANKKFRRTDYEDDVPPSMHRKMTESWNICDYCCTYTLAEWLEWAKNPHSRRGREYEYDEESETIYWKKVFHRK